MPASQQISDAIEQRFGTSRREFMTFCTGIAATLGLANSATAQVAEAITKKQRPSVIWLHHQECTGCTESLLRAEHPTLEKLILDIISLDYHETLFAAAGHQVEAARKAAQEKNKGKYLLVVEGAIPMKDGGIYCKIGGQTSLELTREAAAGAAAVIAIGSCASWGGMPSTPPNPTGCVGVAEALGRNDILSIPGCPSNPYNFLACVVHFLTFGKLPPTDKLGRPLFAYSRLIHENCERRAHFDAGRFALEFGDDGHRKGHCLYKLGCKGPGNLRQLLHRAVWRCGHAVLAGRHGASLHRLQREGHWLRKADPRAGRPQEPASASRIRARQRGAGHGPEYSRSRGGFRRRGRCCWCRRDAHQEAQRA